MPNRASQFAPFDSLKGFNILLKEIEKEIEQKKEISPDLEEILNNNLKMVKINDLITVKYYYLTEYLEIIGYLKKIDAINKYLIINRTKIFFSDIIELEKYK